MKTDDWIALVGIVLMLIGLVLVSYYYAVNQYMTCTSDPLKYSVKKMYNGTDYSYIRLEIYNDKNDIIPVFLHEVNLIKNQSS